VLRHAQVEEHIPAVRRWGGCSVSIGQDGKQVAHQCEQREESPADVNRPVASVAKQYGHITGLALHDVCVLPMFPGGAEHRSQTTQTTLVKLALGELALEERLLPRFHNAQRIGPRKMSCTVTLYGVACAGVKRASSAEAMRWLTRWFTSA
jgi:hypothetical protein